MKIVYSNESNLDYPCLFVKNLRADVYFIVGKNQHSNNWGGVYVNNKTSEVSFSNNFESFDYPLDGEKFFYISKKTHNYLIKLFKKHQDNSKRIKNIIRICWDNLENKTNF